MILAVVSQKPKGMTLENILKAEKLKKKSLKILGYLEGT